MSYDATTLRKFSPENSYPVESYSDMSSSSSTVTARRARISASSPSHSLPTDTFRQDIVDTVAESVGIRRASAPPLESEANTGKATSVDGAPHRRRDRSISQKEVKRMNRVDMRSLPRHSLPSLKDLLLRSPRGADQTEPYSQATSIVSPRLLQPKVRSLSEKLSLLISFLTKGDRLDTEGLFRVSGSKVEVRKLLDKIARPDSKISDTTSCHVICNALTTLYRELELPRHFKINALNASIQEDPENRALMIEKAFGQFNTEIQYDMMQELITFLIRVQSHSEHNKMTISNLATIFAPVFFDEEIEDAVKKKDLQGSLIINKATIEALQNLLNYYKDKILPDISSSSA